MDTDTVLRQYEERGFEIADLDNGEILFYDLEAEESYALVSDEDGNIPKDLDTPILFSTYDDNGSFQWSVTLDSSYSLFDIFHRFDSEEELLSTLQEIREENIARFDESGF